MMYHSRSSKKKYYIGGSIVVLIALSLFFSHAFGSLLQVIGRPLWISSNAVTERFRIFATNLTLKQTLSAENTILRQQNQSLQLELETAKVIEAENESLKAALLRTDSKQLIAAALLTKPPFSPYDTCIIDIGEDKGVKIGDNVVIQGNVLLGRISEVYAKTARVTFFSSPGQKFDVIVGDKNVQGVAEGKGGGNFQVTLPKDAEVIKGDAVILPSLSTEVYGIVNDIENASNDSFIQIYFRNPVNISKLRFVEIELQ